MQFEKKVSVGAFLRKGEDFKEGDLIKIRTEGEKVQGEYGMQNIFEVETKEGLSGNIAINQTSINGFIDIWGGDSNNWVGKKVKVWKVNQNVSGKFKDVYYFSHPDAELTEDGFVTTIEAEDGIPVIEEPEVKKN